LRNEPNLRGRAWIGKGLRGRIGLGGGSRTGGLEAQEVLERGLVSAAGGGDAALEAVEGAVGVTVGMAEGSILV